MATLGQHSPGGSEALREDTTLHKRVSATSQKQKQRPLLEDAVMGLLPSPQIMCPGELLKDSVKGTGTLLNSHHRYHLHSSSWNWLDVNTKNQQKVSFTHHCRFRDDGNGVMNMISIAGLLTSLHQGLKALNYTTNATVFLLTTVLFLAMSLQPVCSQTQPSWDAKPVSSSVREGSSVTLACRFSNLGNSKIAWLKDNNNIFVDGDRWGAAPDRFNVSRYQSGTIGGYDLILTDATRQDDSDYTCQLQSGTLIATAHLTILVPPGIPIISRNTTDPLTEDDYVKFTCLTENGNPPPEITWLRKTEASGQWEILPVGSRTPPAAKFGSTRSELTRMIERMDHRSQFKCSAENEASQGTPAERIVPLDVRYAPIIRIRPADHTGSKLVVIDGSNVTLVCDVDSNPPTSSRLWEKDGAQIAAPNFRSAAKEDSGNYSCLATNEIRSTRTWLMLDVQYGPRVRVSASRLVNNTLTVAEGARISLTCRVDANPVVNTIQWTDAFENVIKWGATYDLESVLRTKAGRLKCTAENILHPTAGPEQQKKGSQSIQLVVQYPPGKANITGPRYVLKGEEAVLICHVADKGVPEAAIEWTRLGDPSNAIISRQAELRFPSAQLINNADFICKPTNTINDGGPDTFRLVVNERPELTAGGELADRLVVNMTQLSPLMVQCQARGRPLPDVRWEKDDRPIRNQDGLFMVEREHVAIDVHSFLVTTTLYWKGSSRDRLDRLQRSDTGKYRCYFSNEHGNTHSQMELTVQYMPILNITSDKVATDMNQSAALSCSAQAVPVPRFEWYNGTSRLVNSGRVTIATDVVNGPFPYTSTLNISDVTMEDLGEYKCVGINSLGFAEKHIFLTVKTTPDAPSGLMVKSKTWESVELMWEAGFDGGYQQTFYIFYLSSRQNNSRHRVNPNNNSRVNVTGLFPSTTYTFKVFGENQLGGGEYSANVSTVTPGHPIEPPIEVFYHLESRTLSFISPSTNYCVRIEVFDDVTWTVYEECAPSTGSVKIREGVPLSDVRIALCLQRRQAICSAKTKAILVKPPQEDLSIGTIIAVACVCGTVVLTLLIILIVLCVRRYQAKKEYENDLNTPRPPVNKKINGIDNPSMDQTDMVDMDPTSRQRRQNNANYNIGYDSKSDTPQANGYPALNGGPNWAPRSNSNIPVEPPPDYREVEHENRGNSESEYIAMHKARKRQKSDGPDGHDSGYIPEHLKEGSDSGLSTPDPTKPKKGYTSGTCMKLNTTHSHQMINSPPIYNISGPLFNFNDCYHTLHAINERPMGGRSYLDPACVDRLTSRSDCSSWTLPWRGTSQQPPVSLIEQQVAPPFLAENPRRPLQNQPLLRVSDDSPYGFHGAPEVFEIKKSLVKTPYRTEAEMKENYWTGNIRRSATLTMREPDIRHTDIIRGTIHSSMRVIPSKDILPENYPQSGIPNRHDKKVVRHMQGTVLPLEHDRRSGQNMPRPELSYEHGQIPVKHRPGAELSHGYDRKSGGSIPRTEPSYRHNQISTQHRPVAELLDGRDKNAAKQTPGAIVSNQPAQKAAQNTPLTKVRKPEMNGEKNSGYGYDECQSTLNSDNPPDIVRGSPETYQTQKTNTTKSIRKMSRPNRAKIKTSMNHIPSDPRDAIAALIKEQKANDSDTSDENNTVHSIKPSAMKNMMRKKRDRSNIPRQPRRPPSTLFVNKEMSQSKNDDILSKANKPSPLKKSAFFKYLDEVKSPKVTGIHSESRISGGSICNNGLGKDSPKLSEGITDFTSPEVRLPSYIRPTIDNTADKDKHSLHVVSFECDVKAMYESDTDEHRPIQECDSFGGERHSYAGPTEVHFHHNTPNVDYYQNNVAGSLTFTNLSQPLCPTDATSIQHQVNHVNVDTNSARRSHTQNYLSNHPEVSGFYRVNDKVVDNENVKVSGIRSMGMNAGRTYSDRDITQHYVPPPPGDPPPEVPSNMEVYSIESSLFSNEANASVRSQSSGIGRNGWTTLPGRHRPPTPPSVRLIPHRQKRLLKRNQPHSKPRIFNGDGKCAPSSCEWLYESSSGGSDQPRSSISTPVTSHDEIITNSTSRGSLVI